MCYGASFWAGLDTMLIGARAEDVTELSAFDEGPLPADWIGELRARGIEVRRDLSRDAARDVFHRYAAEERRGVLSNRRSLRDGTRKRSARNRRPLQKPTWNCTSGPMTGVAVAPPSASETRGPRSSAVWLA